MNFKENESPQKLRGGYYTDNDIVSFLLRWVLEKHPTNILEPSCGDGAFIRGIAREGKQSIEKITAFEIDEREAEKARGVASELESIETNIYAKDFLSWALFRLLESPEFDAVIGNPPFIRYQYLDDKLQEESERIFRTFSLPFTRHTNAWVPFVLASIGLLKPGGRLAMVLPAELLHILHAESLRNFLAKKCSKILIFDPQDIWF